MKYGNGAEIRIGHRVRLANGEHATVVFSIDADEYSNEFPKTDWEYLAAGVMIRTDEGALIHLKPSDSNEIQPI